MADWIADLHGLNVVALVLYRDINFGLLVGVAPLMYIVMRTIPEIMPMAEGEEKEKEVAERAVKEAK